MLTNVTFLTDEEALALKKAADRTISSEVNRSYVFYYSLWNGNYLIIWFSMLQLRTRQETHKKGKMIEKDNDVPPKKGKKKLHNEVRCLSKHFHFSKCDTLKLLFLLFHVGRYLMRRKRRRGWQMM